MQFANNFYILTVWKDYPNRKHEDFPVSSILNWLDITNKIASNYRSTLIAMPGSSMEMCYLVAPLKISIFIELHILLMHLTTKELTVQFYVKLSKRSIDGKSEVGFFVNQDKISALRNLQK